MTCFNCEHGRSWHETLVMEYRWNWDWVTKTGKCQVEGCNCKHYMDKRAEHYEKESAESGNYLPEQIQLLEKLKQEEKERKPQIIIDKDFHELFCHVLKEETNRECDCEGTTGEIRRKK